MSEFIDLNIDDDAGEASVSFSELFHSQGALWKIDVLGDIIQSLTNELGKVNIEFEQEMQLMRHKGRMQ